MSPAPPQPPLALLLEELVEEILLRVPPDDPARLARAALVCKSWCRVVSGPGFRRRFRQFHRVPPMLGVFADLRTVSRFVRTSSSSTCPQFAVRRKCKVIDTRHGRVLLRSGLNLLNKPLVVWDPITDHWRELPLPRGCLLVPRCFNAALLCAASLGGTCDHLDCRCEPFLVVLVVRTHGREMVSYVYSSEVGAWIDRRSMQHPDYHFIPVPSALVGNVLYFSCWNWNHKCVIKFDLGTKEMSPIRLPSNSIFGSFVLMAMESGELGFATVVMSTLCMASHDRDAGWVESRSIQLKSLLPAGCDPASVYVIGAADSIGVIFLHANVGILNFDLNSSRVTKVWRKSRCRTVFPYLSFYTPAQVMDSEQAAQVLEKH